MSALLAYIAASLGIAWGIVHVIPTRRVLAALEPTNADNRWMFLQEWLVEAVAMWGIAGVAIVGTATQSSTPGWLYRTLAVILIALAALTAFTGARTAVVWFKICVGLLAVEATLFIVASLV